jgi:hypothetical protein
MTSDLLEGLAMSPLIAVLCERSGRKASRWSCDHRAILGGFKQLLILMFNIMISGLEVGRGGHLLIPRGEGSL